MKKEILFDGYSIHLHYDDLEEDSIISIYAKNEGVASIALELMLDDLGIKNLWYSSCMHFNGYSFEITLVENDRDYWKNWSRQKLLAIANTDKTKNN